MKEHLDLSRIRKLYDEMEVEAFVLLEKEGYPKSNEDLNGPCRCAILGNFAK